MKIRVLPVMAVIALAGCSKVHDTRTFSVETHGGNTLSITATVSEQKLTIVLSSDLPVSIWVLLEKDVPSGSKDDFDPDTMKSGIVAKEKNTKEATLQATIPAKEKFQIY